MTLLWPAFGSAGGTPAGLHRNSSKNCRRDAGATKTRAPLRERYSNIFLISRSYSGK